MNVTIPRWMKYYKKGWNYWWMKEYEQMAIQDKANKSKDIDYELRSLLNNVLLVRVFRDYICEKSYNALISMASESNENILTSDYNINKNDFIRYLENNCKQLNLPINQNIGFELTTEDHQTLINFWDQSKIVQDNIDDGYLNNSILSVCEYKDESIVFTIFPETRLYALTEFLILKFDKLEEENFNIVYNNNKLTDQQCNIHKLVSNTMGIIELQEDTKLDDEYTSLNDNNLKFRVISLNEGNEQKQCDLFNENKLHIALQESIKIIEKVEKLEKAVESTQKIVSNFKPTIHTIISFVEMTSAQIETLKQKQKQLDVQVDIMGQKFKDVKNQIIEQQMAGQDTTKSKAKFTEFLQQAQPQICSQRNMGLLMSFVRIEQMINDKLVEVVQM